MKRILSSVGTTGRRRRVVLAAAVWMAACAATPAAMAADTAAAERACDRACLVDVVHRVVASMPTHRPDSLPLAPVYAATENSHPAALGMMAAWRTITKTGQPALEAVDVPRGQAYFALPVDEGSGLSALRGRIKVVDRRITELEIYINRSRGDHGFSFSAERMARNYQALTALPANRVKASRDELEKLARASFDASDPYKLDIADDCQFSEEGSLVVDPGLDDQPLRPNSEAPLGCLFPPFRPTDLKARVVAVDEETGIVVVAAVVPGTVFPYPFRGHMLSAFIPDDMKEAGQIQQAWIRRRLKAGKTGLLAPTPATGECVQVLQLYDGKLHASQINVYLSGPQMHSVWVK